VPERQKPDLLAEPQPARQPHLDVPRHIGDDLIEGRASVHPGRLARRMHHV
jgi:hypothetical protein